MIWKVREYDRAYERIKRHSLEGGMSVLIFVAPDCDAICACRIFTGMLRADCIRYKIKPVSGYKDIKRLNDKMVKGNDDLRSIVMLNCGAIVDVRTILSLGKRQSCYIVDSHRPLHLKNVYCDKQICILDDGSTETNRRNNSENIPSDGSDLSANNYASSESDSSFDEEIASETEERESPEGAASSAKRKRSQAVKARKRVRRDALDEYYTYTYYGNPCSTSVYRMSQQLNKDQNDYLWMAIVGLSNHYLQQHIEHTEYTKLAQEYRREVMIKNAQEAEEAWETEDGTAVPAAANGKIQFEEDYRFMMLRCWTLYDSMYYSDYVASKLFTWHHNGEQKLRRFLAKIGIPLRSSKLPYAHMSDEMKTRLKTNIKEHKDAFGLDEVLYGTFRRQHGYNTAVAAADAVYSVIALLESHVGGWEYAFFNAYDSLSDRRPDLRQRGLKLSTELQKAVVRKGTNIIENKKVVPHGVFRCVTLTNLSEADMLTFTQPLALLKLARFVVNANREQGTWARLAKPLVVLALNEKRKLYTVVGVPCKGRWEVEQNILPRAFTIAARSVNGVCLHDGFDSSVMALEEQHSKRFKVALFQVLSN